MNEKRIEEARELLRLARELDVDLDGWLMLPEEWDDLYFVDTTHALSIVKESQFVLCRVLRRGPRYTSWNSMIKSVTGVDLATTGAHFSPTKERAISTLEQFIGAGEQG